MAHISHAQFVGIPSITYYSRADYQGGTQNWDITQNASGLMYIANNNGLLEFDGTDWKLYRVKTAGVTRATKYIDGKIYLSNYDEVGYFQKGDNQQLNYVPLSQKHVGGEVWNIYPWQKGVLFQSDNKILLFDNDSLVSEIESTTQFKSAYKANGMMLVHQDGVGLVELRGNKLFAIKDGSIFDDKQISGIVELSPQLTVIFTMNNGMYLWDSSGIFAWNVSSNKILKEYNIYTATKYNDNCILIGTIQSGLLAINAKGDIILHLNKDHGLENNTVLSLMIDAERNVWCGLDNGIAHVQMNTSVSYLQSYYSIGTVYDVEKFGSHFYFGTNQGLYKIHEKEFYNPQKTPQSFTQVPNTKGQVWALHNDGNKMLCGHNFGIFVIDNNKAEKISPVEIKGAWVFRSCPNDSNKLIVGTYDGFCTLRRDRGKWKFDKKVENYNYSARFVELDEYGNVWVTHGSEGIDRIYFNDSYDKVDSVKHYEFEALSPNVQTATVGKLDSRCIFFSNKGFYAIDHQKDSFALCSEFREYFDEDQYPNKAMVDRFQNIWYYQSGCLGVMRRLEDGNYQKISNPFSEIKDKLIPSFESMYVVNEKDAIFAIEDGIAYYSSSTAREFPKHINLNLRSFKSNSDSVVYAKWQEGGLNVQANGKPTFNYRQNSFTIRYSASQYTKGDVLYSSMLQGYDDHMSNWVSRNYREYSNIPAGNYTFVVQAKNESGVISTPLEFEFTVLSPWYFTSWAVAVYVVILIMLIYLYYLMMDRSFKRRQAEDKDKQRRIFLEKEEQMKKEALEAEKEIIRLRNETLQTQIHHNEKELANTTMSVIKKNDFLLEVKESLQEIRRSKHANSHICNMVTQMITKINRDIENDNHWELFETHIDAVHEDFLSRLRKRHPDLNKREEQLMAYIRMGMSSKEIASLLNISVRSVENNRSRLRHKIKLGSGENLVEYVLSI